MIRVLIADDHPIFRQGLRQVLTESPDITVADEAGSGHETLAKIRKQKFDLVTLDISMPDVDGLDVLKQIRAERPNLPVLMLSIYPEEQFAVRALRAGAQGYLTKNSVPDELVQAVHQVVGGGTYITAALAQRLAQEVQQPRAATRPHECLSDREYEILRLLASGLTVSEIAAKLFLSVKTVSTHRAHILHKMKMDSTAQIMRYAIENGLVKQ